MLAQISSLRPNEAHAALETLSSAAKNRGGGFNVTVVTQNVDGLHQKAAAEAAAARARARMGHLEGTASLDASNVSSLSCHSDSRADRVFAATHELHGSCARVTCLADCGWSAAAEPFLKSWDAANSSAATTDTADDDDDRNDAWRVTHTRKRSRTTRPRAIRAGIPFPTCGGCGVAPAKPDCVLFGEALPERAVKAAREAFSRAHAVVIIGTSLSVFPAAGFPGLSRTHVNPRAPLIRVDAGAANCDPDFSGPDDAYVAGKAAEVVPRLVDRVLYLRRRGIASADSESSRARARHTGPTGPKMFS
jgi:NAD-dependent SIR2 family protein deacetylase